MVFLLLVKNRGFNASLGNGYALNPIFDSKSIFICKKFVFVVFTPYWKPFEF